MTDEITLTDDQQKALDEIITWYNDPEASQYKTLSGFAGTGKTTLLNFIIQELNSQEGASFFARGPKIAVTATTNKAVKVLTEFIDAEHFATIHSMLNIKPYQYGTKEIFKPDRLQENNINRFDLVIIDECSMISSEDSGSKKEERSLLRIIKEEVHPSVKVLFCGDKAQLQPINEQVSKCFNYEPVELTHIIRHGNEIADKAKLVRNTDREVELHELLSGDAIKKISKDEVWPYFEGFRMNPDQCRMLPWTNRKVDMWNEELRIADYGKRMPRFVEGDIIMANKPCLNKVENDHGRNYYEVVMMNSEEGIVHDVEEKESHWKLLVQTESGETPVLRVVKESYQQELDETLQTLAEEARAAGRGARKEWDKYWALRKYYHEIKHCYSLTTHKAQGSTFDRVILDWHDLNQNWDVLNRNQLIYVAMTRAAKQVLIYV